MEKPCSYLQTALKGEFSGTYPIHRRSSMSNSKVRTHPTVSSATIPRCLPTMRLQRTAFLLSHTGVIYFTFRKNHTIDIINRKDRNYLIRGFGGYDLFFFVISHQLLSIFQLFPFFWRIGWFFLSDYFHILISKINF